MYPSDYFLTLREIGFLDKQQVLHCTSLENNVNGSLGFMN